MEEARHHRGKTAFPIVNKGIQNARPALLWKDIEVGNHSWYQCTMPLF